MSNIANLTLDLNALAKNLGIDVATLTAATATAKASTTDLKAEVDRLALLAEGARKERDAAQTLFTKASEAFRDYMSRWNVAVSTLKGAGYTGDVAKVKSKTRKAKNTVVATSIEQVGNAVEARQEADKAPIEAPKAPTQPLPPKVETGKAAFAGKKKK